MNLNVKQQVKKTLLVMLAVTVTLGVIKFIQIRLAIAESARFAPPPASVTTVRVKKDAWRDTFQAVGSFAAIRGATLGTQEAGNVVRVGFESGARVVEGQVLLELDRSVEEANLQGAIARLELAKQNLSRAQTLKSQSAVSLANYDDALAKVKQGEAEVRSIKGVIERKTIVAPFSGRAGIRAVNEGQYVGAGTPLVPLYSVDPIHFNFSVPQQVAPALKDSKERVRIEVDAFPNQTFEGAVTAVNPNINEITRAVEVQATVPNPGEDLLPGMFGQLRIELGEPKEIVAVPVSSVQYAPYGNSVYVVERKADERGKETTTVRQQIVQLGDKRGDFVSVLSGLSTGDEVVTLGTFKLRPGAPVDIRANQGVPASLEPEVKNS
jgi:membrane fusion protein (multidrug efflux system)